MAWVAPSNRSTGDIVTAAIWNQDAVANPQYLYDQIDNNVIQHLYGNTHRIESGTLQLTGTSGRVSFGNVFASAPTVIITAVGTFDDYKVNTPTTTGVEIVSANSNSAFVAWQAEGPVA